MKVTAHSNDTFISVSGPKRASNELRSCVCLSVCLFDTSMGFPLCVLFYSYLSTNNAISSFSIGHQLICN